MSRYVDLPARGHLPSASILARISTPRNRNATTIDPTHPTILLAHPGWTDSFFFYPQYDEPAFNEYYNLVSLDVRGHGETIIEPLESGSFESSDAADDAYLALRELGVESAHVLGAAPGGSTIAFHLALRYPGFVISLSMVNPHMPVEDKAWTVGFDEISSLLTRAVEGDDAEALDDVTLGVWNWGLGEGHSSTEPIKDLRQRFMDFQRIKLADGRLRTTLPYHVGLHASRCKLVPREEMAKFTCPVLILHGTEASGLGLLEQYNDFAQLLNNASSSRPKQNQPPQASVLCVGDEPQLMTLTSPYIVHHHILDHILTSSIPHIESIPPSPLSAQFSSRSSRASLSSISSISRRTSSPREMTGFNIPPPPKLGPGVLTLGQVLDREKQEGIPMTVEVRVEVHDGEGEAVGSDESRR